MSGQSFNIWVQDLPCEIGVSCHSTGKVPAGLTLNNLGVWPGGGEAPGAVPEPASWALMIAGFGLVGIAMRRRQVSISFAEFQGRFQDRRSIL